MKLAELSPETLSKIKSVRWDRIIEKHEGPEDWESVLEYYEPEFREVDERWVLLPIEGSHHPNITILHTIKECGWPFRYLFLKDTTYDDDPFSCGFLAVCHQVKGEDFYLAIVYHEWFIIELAPGIFE